MGKQVVGGIRVEKRAKGKWWAVSEPKNARPEFRGPFDSMGEAEAAMLDILGLGVDVEQRPDGWWVRMAILDGSPPDQGPFPSRMLAELLKKQTLQDIREMVGLRPVPDGEAEGHFMQGSVMIDHGQENATKPRGDLTRRPADYAERLERARRLNELATELGADDLDLLLAAWQRLDPAGKTHHTLLLLHARAVIAWAQRPDPERTPLHELEGKLRTLAALLSGNITPGEEYVLLLANHGEGKDDPNSFFTHISSMDRPTTVSLLGEYLGRLKQLLQGRS